MRNIIDFSMCEFNGQKCLLIIGVPKSAQNDLNSLLRELGIQNDKNIEILIIPDEIIND